MNSIMLNWKTSLAGVVLIIVGLLGSLLGLHIPGFAMEPGVALTTGIALLMAKDSTPTPPPSVKMLIAIFILPLACLFVLLAEARAGDINAPAPATKAPAYTLPTYPTLNGLILSVYTEGGGGSVSASAPGVPSASLTTTTAGVGATVGYMFTPKKSPFSYSIEGDVCAQNFNGNNAGFSVQGPLCFEARFMVWAPWQQIISAISAVIPLPNPFSSISAFPIMTNGVSPVGATLAGLGGGIYGKDISTAFVGVQAGKVVRVDPEIVAMLVQPLSNGGAIREFVKTDFNSQSQIIGSVPKGQTLATLGSIGIRAGVGYAF